MNAWHPLVQRAVFAGLAMGILVAHGVESDASTPPGHPNIIFILADDLGYGDLGVLYQNSRPSGMPRMATPQLDSMAAQGMVLRQHYTSAPVCAPARASLLMGQNQGNCPIRDNQFDKALPVNHTLATVLKRAGYYTGAIGKWGLQGRGPSFPGHPLRHGFDEFYGVLGHGQAHHHYPGNTGLIMDMFSPITNGLDAAYDTDLYAARAKKFIRERASAPAKPFFLYLAFTAPHFFEELPTQPYPSGRGLKGGLQWPLNTNSGRTNSWYHPDYANQDWPDVEKRHATMVRRLDDAVGDILQLLRDLNLAANTLVVFSSDNGPHNEKGQDPRFFGSWGVMHGIKRDLWEAGIREPTFAWWPGHIAPRSSSDFACSFSDWMPTFAQLGGLPPPAQSDGVSLMPTLLGSGRQRSRGFLYWEYAFVTKRLKQFPVDRELFARKAIPTRGQLQALRLGNFTAVRYAITNSSEPFRLYNVATDPHEDFNLAQYSTNAALMKQINELVRQVRRPEPSTRRPYDGDLVPPVHSASMKPGSVRYAVFPGAWPWVPDFDALVPANTGEAATLEQPLNETNAAFGASFKGVLDVPRDGLYTFYLKSDSGAQMWVHEAHVIDDDFNHDGTEISASILLQAGAHPVRLFYRHSPGPVLLSVEFSGPDISRRPVFGKSP
ncbi:MAG TPA: sulfatase-like hydrolase/transferase [Verrucomicrobiae bacterium]|nr:sulfatase-like hydrolase/transferase [Verrucomicrobiae bacterium]